MKPLQVLLAAVALAANLAASALGYEFNGTKWGIGPNSATYLVGYEGTPGYFTWSIMRSDLGFEGYENHFGLRTVEFGSLLGTSSQSEEIAAISSALAKWSTVCGLTAVGPLADGEVNGGAPESMGGHLGDMRFGAVRGGFGGNFLGHAYQPGNESIYGAGGSIAGDIHMNTLYQFIDDPNHIYQGGREFDFETVMLHEIGHSLGLAHSEVPGSVMYGDYTGARRELRPDDIAGIQYIYGPVPAPMTLAVFGAGLAGVSRRRRS